MTSYAKKERARYWPVSPELMAQYCDGSHNGKYNGSLLWYQNGELHRDGDNPAYIDPGGYLGWYQNGQPHRSHGPAVINPSGILEWWVNGEEITDEVNKWIGKKHWRGTPEQVFEFQLRFL